MLRQILFFTLLYPFALFAQVKVDLNVHVPKKITDSLFIAGNFNDWNPRNTNYSLIKKDSLAYFISLNLPKGNFEFKITRGSWDKAESKSDGKPTPNRTVNLNVDTVMNINVVDWTDNFKQLKEEYQYGDHIHVVDSELFIPQLNKNRKIWIYLPKSYKDSRKQYPVIYMHDGQNLFHSNPPRSNEWAVDTVMDSLIRTGAKEMIIVAVDHGGKNRLIEYNPYDSQFGKGEGKAYVSFLVETLKPFIDSKYRTLKDAKNTSIVGSSMGGLISMYAIANYPKVFGSAGVFSPAFWVAPKIYDDIALNLAGMIDSKVYFVAGDKESTDMVPDMKKAYVILNPNGKKKNVVFVEKEDGKHSGWFWHREFVPFYQFIAR
ncbi:alpha/beta hydrolase [Pedobacter rhodius]|uniref:Alpha/beta hydrolase-fold protein n=1 Tax=Pedobacter rhodius TaxID=3004098 RepID=A0ABT4L0C1_9SPHI|nr:alpha/beta hydrolase-fold protein [Pedobacter sp. SJ11]MCZ4224614.1 alpha/beta hydrolase-fold protein [Pedobacter sp. SJ11]